MTGDARESYDVWHRTLAAEGDVAALAPWHENAIPHIGSVAGKRVLEIGCGRGAFGAWLAGQRVAHAVLADFSVAAVAVARSGPGSQPGLSCIAADIERLPFADGTFDVTCSFETIEHVPHPAAAVAELVRVTRPGGRLVVSSPNYLGLAGLYRIYRRLIGRPFTEMGQPINQPLLLPWRVRLLRRLGCDVNVVDGFGHYAYVPGRRPLRLAFLDGARPLTKWFALHSLTVATRRQEQGAAPIVQG